MGQGYWSPDHRPRPAILLLVLALHALLLLLLLRLAPPPDRPEKILVPISVELISDQAVTPARSRAPKKERQPEREERPDEPPAPAVRPDALPAPAWSIWSQVIPLTREQMAAADIGRFPKRPPAGETGASESGETDDSSGPGSGPNGETLYNARWYRPPTNAELSTYLPPGRPPVGWGLVACQTVPGNRVDNCHELGQSPAGSGLAGAVRKAAWQFRVLPPRIGGRAMVGAWVRIRIDYEIEEAAE